MITAIVNTSKFTRALAHARAQSPRIRREAGMAAASEFVRSVVLVAPKDTNRYARAWALGGSQAGLKGMILLPLKRSGYAKRHVERLTKQIEFWKKRLDRARRKHDFWIGVEREYGKLRGRQRTLLKAAAKDEETAERTLFRAVEELAVFKAADEMGQAPIVIYGRTTTRGEKNGTAGPRRRLGITVRGKVYGGSGKIAEYNGRTVVELTNHEPHAKIVEKRTRIVRNRLPAARAYGLVVGRRLYVNVFKQAMGRPELPGE